MAFDTAQHPRARDGKFVATLHGEPDGLDDPGDGACCARCGGETVGDPDGSRRHVTPGGFAHPSADLDHDPVYGAGRARVTAAVDDGGPLVSPPGPAAVAEEMFSRVYTPAQAYRRLDGGYIYRFTRDCGGNPGPGHDHRTLAVYEAIRQCPALPQDASWDDLAEAMTRIGERADANEAAFEAQVGTAVRQPGMYGAVVGAKYRAGAPMAERAKTIRDDITALVAAGALPAFRYTVTRSSRDSRVSVTVDQMPDDDLYVPSDLHYGRDRSPAHRALVSQLNRITGSVNSQAIDAQIDYFNVAFTSSVRVNSSTETELYAAHAAETRARSAVAAAKRLGVDNAAAYRDAALAHREASQRVVRAREADRAFWDALERRRGDGGR